MGDSFLLIFKVFFQVPILYSSLPCSEICGSLKDVFRMTRAWKIGNDWIPVEIDHEGVNVFRIYTCVLIENINPCF